MFIYIYIYEWSPDGWYLVIQTSAHHITLQCKVSKIIPNATIHNSHLTLNPKPNANHDPECSERRNFRGNPNTFYCFFVWWAYSSSAFSILSGKLTAYSLQPIA